MQYQQGVGPDCCKMVQGILVGPYCANLVSQMHITIIGGMINKVSLAFIAGPIWNGFEKNIEIFRGSHGTSVKNQNSAGAAGAEIFLPELQGLLRPMALQAGAEAFDLTSWQSKRYFGCGCEVLLICTATVSWRKFSFEFGGFCFTT